MNTNLKIVKYTSGYYAVYDNTLKGFLDLDGSVTWGAPKNIIRFCITSSPNRILNLLNKMEMKMSTEKTKSEREEYYSNLSNCREVTIEEVKQDIGKYAWYKIPVFFRRLLNSGRA